LAVPSGGITIVTRGQRREKKISTSKVLQTAETEFNQ
jgi:hypothetical protein